MLDRVLAHVKLKKQKNKVTKFKEQFKERVQNVVRGIKRGETLSYKEVAFRAGNPNAARAVGMVMSRNTDKTIPCHRVIRSDGKLGGYNGLRGDTKERLLRKERGM